MSHTFIAFNVARTTMVIEVCENFWFKKLELANDNWVTGICLSGGEFELIASMLEHLDNPQMHMYEDEDDYEPEYTLAGGYAAYDA